MSHTINIIKKLGLCAFFILSTPIAFLEATASSSVVVMGPATHPQAFGRVSLMDPVAVKLFSELKSDLSQKKPSLDFNSKVNRLNQFRLSWHQRLQQLTEGRSENDLLKDESFGQMIEIQTYVMQIHLKSPSECEPVKARLEASNPSDESAPQKKLFGQLLAEDLLSSFCQ